MLDLGGIFAQSAAYPGQYLGSVIEMPLCDFPLALEGLSCPVQKFLLIISSLFLLEVGLPQPEL